MHGKVLWEIKVRCIKFASLNLLAFNFHLCIKSIYCIDSPLSLGWQDELHIGPPLLTSSEPPLEWLPNMAFETELA